ncbi:hypothetical protein ACFL2T_00970, partial [Elusimicrobiota bacterium]
MSEHQIDLDPTVPVGVSCAGRLAAAWSHTAELFRVLDPRRRGLFTLGLSRTFRELVPLQSEEILEWREGMDLWIKEQRSKKIVACVFFSGLAAGGALLILMYRSNTWGLQWEWWAMPSLKSTAVVWFILLTCLFHGVYAIPLSFIIACRSVNLLRQVRAVVRFIPDYLKLGPLGTGSATPATIREAAPLLARLSMDSRLRLFGDILARTANRQLKQILKDLIPDSRTERAAERWACYLEFRRNRQRLVEHLPRDDHKQRLILIRYLKEIEVWLRPGEVDATVMLRDLFDLAAKTCSSVKEFRSRVDYLSRTRRSSWFSGQIVEDFRELACYENARNELLAHFDATPRERVHMAWRMNVIRTRLSRLALPADLMLQAAIRALSENGLGQEDFVGLVSTLEGIREETVLYRIMRDVDAVIGYIARNRSRNWRGLAEGLNRLGRRVAEVPEVDSLVMILEELSAPDAELPERVRAAKRHLDDEDLIRDGVPRHLLRIDDPVGWDELLDAIGKDPEVEVHPREIFRQRLRSEPAKVLMKYMKPKGGLHAYFREDRPQWYVKLLRDLPGIAESWDAPGLRFSVTYDPTLVKTAAAARKMPPGPILASTRLELFAGIIKELRAYPGLEKAFRKVFRSKIELKPGVKLEDAVKETDLADKELCRTLVARVLSSRALPKLDKKPGFLARLIEIGTFNEETRPSSTSSHEEVGRHYSAVGDLVRQWLKPGAPGQLCKPVETIFKARAMSLANEGPSRDQKGVLHFVLSAKTPQDLFRGYAVCRDCSRTRHYFWNQLGPQYLLFKIMEKNAWVGMLIACAVVDKQAAFGDQNERGIFVDWIRMVPGHPLAEKGSHGAKAVFADGLLRQIIGFACRERFQFVVLSKDIGSDRRWATCLDRRLSVLGRESGELRMAGSHQGHQRLIGMSPNKDMTGAWNLPNEQGFGAPRSGGYRLDLSPKGLRPPRPGDVDGLSARLDALRIKKRELTIKRDKTMGRVKELERTYAVVTLQRKEHMSRKDGEMFNDAFQVFADRVLSNRRRLVNEAKQFDKEIESLNSACEMISARLACSESGNPQERGFLDIGALLAIPLLPGSLLGLPPIVELLLGLACLALVVAIAARAWRRKPKSEPSPAVDETQDPAHEEPATEIVEEADVPPPWPARSRRAEELVKSVIAKIPRDKLSRHSATISRIERFGLWCDGDLKALELIARIFETNTTVMDFLKKQDFYKAFKQRTRELGLREDFDQPNGVRHAFQVASRTSTPPLEFQMELSKRDPESIMRGEVSGDCCGLTATAFLPTIPRFLLHPAFLSFRVYSGEQWISNIYSLVTEIGGEGGR